MGDRVVPTAEAEDCDDVVVALETSRVSEERGDLESASKWLHRAAAAARHQGRPDRAGVLSRSAARLARAIVNFQKKPDEAHTLGDIDDDDFSEKTIVETTADIARKNQDAPSSKPSSKEVPSEKKSTSHLEPRGADELLVEKPTPIAPLANQPIAPAHHAIRVGVKKALGGKFEARPLSDGESPATGEQEALLVPTQTGSKLG